jgi:hypothetical protein
MVVKDGTITIWLPAFNGNGESNSANTYATSVLNALAQASAASVIGASDSSSS